MSSDYLKDQDEVNEERLQHYAQMQGYLDEIKSKPKSTHPSLLTDYV